METLPTQRDQCVQTIANPKETIQFTLMPAIQIAFLHPYLADKLIDERVINDAEALRPRSHRNTNAGVVAAVATALLLRLLQLLLR